MQLSQQERFIFHSKVCWHLQIVTYPISGQTQLCQQLQDDAVIFKKYSSWLLKVYMKKSFLHYTDDSRLGSWTLKALLTICTMQPTKVRCKWWTPASVQLELWVSQNLEGDAILIDSIYCYVYWCSKKKPAITNTAAATTTTTTITTITTTTSAAGTVMTITATVAADTTTAATATLLRLLIVK